MRFANKCYCFENTVLLRYMLTNKNARKMCQKLHASANNKKRACQKITCRHKLDTSTLLACKS